MARKGWTSTDIQKLFRLQQRYKSRQILMYAEDRGEIPTAKRIQRGSQSVRMWETAQLPGIGGRFGFVKKPGRQLVLCVYTSKGGILKSTVAYCLARILALNNIKTLLIGLDVQCTVSDTAIPPPEVGSLEDYQEAETPGLFHLLFDNARLEDVVRETDLPTLAVIPEGEELNSLEKELRNRNRREYGFKDHLIGQLGGYDVIVFDNTPNWNGLIENALVCSSVVLSPLGCDLNTYKASRKYLANVTGFQAAMQLKWDHFILLPTLLEKSKLSQQIYGAYLNQYGDTILPTPIRRTVLGQESLLEHLTPIEHAPTSPLAQDYYEMTVEFWSRVAGSAGVTAAA